MATIPKVQVSVKTENSCNWCCCAKRSPSPAIEVSEKVTQVYQRRYQHRGSIEMRPDQQSIMLEDMLRRQKEEK